MADGTDVILYESRILRVLGCQAVPLGANYPNAPPRLSLEWGSRMGTHPLNQGLFISIYEVDIISNGPLSRRGDERTDAGVLERREG